MISGDELHLSAESRQNLDEALTPFLEEGWTLSWQNDTMAHLTRGQEGLDLTVDAQGAINITSQPSPSLQFQDRIRAWGVLLLSFLLVLAVAAALGWFN